MGKVNTKAGATQVSQDVATEQAAQEQQQQQETTAAQEPAPALQEAPQEQPKEETQQAPAPAPEENLIVEPVAQVAPPAEAAEQPKATVTEAAKPVAANASLTEQLGVILKNVPAAYQTDIARVLAYLERMAPNRPVDAKVGIEEQKALYRSIQNIINRQEEYFTPLFTALLFIFKSETKGALSDRYRMRFMDNITLPVGDRKAFANLSQMLAIVADPKSRAVAMKQVSMERALENGLTPEGRTRVLNYFEL